MIIDYSFLKAAEMIVVYKTNLSRILYGNIYSQSPLEAKGGRTPISTVNSNEALTPCSHTVQT